MDLRNNLYIDNTTANATQKTAPTQGRTSQQIAKNDSSIIKLPFLFYFVFFTSCASTTNGIANIQIIQNINISPMMQYYLKKTIPSVPATSSISPMKAFRLSFSLKTIYANATDITMLSLSIGTTTLIAPS